MCYTTLLNMFRAACCSKHVEERSVTHILLKIKELCIKLVIWKSIYTGVFLLYVFKYILWEDPILTYSKIFWKYSVGKALDVLYVFCTLWYNYVMLINVIVNQPVLSTFSNLLDCLHKCMKNLTYKAACTI